MKKLNDDFACNFNKREKNQLELPGFDPDTSA